MIIHSFRTTLSTSQTSVRNYKCWPTWLKENTHPSHVPVNMHRLNTLRTTTIDQWPSHMYLCLQLTNDLSWSAHIEKTSSANHSRFGRRHKTCTTISQTACLPNISAFKIRVRFISSVAIATLSLNSHWSCPKSRSQVHIFLLLEAW